MPANGFENKPTVRFLHSTDRVLATASTCELVLRLPALLSNNCEKVENVLFWSLLDLEFVEVFESYRALLLQLLSTHIHPYLVSGFWLISS